MAVTIFDKAKWQTEKGIDTKLVIRHFTIVLNWLNENDMLSSEGKEILELGIDSEISLNSKLVNSKGLDFLMSNYDEIISSTEYGSEVFCTKANQML